MSSLSDLLDHFKLDAEIAPNFTLHVSYRPNRARGLRKERCETRWLRTKRIGGGMFSDVWLEEHGEDNMKEQRAVKVINKARMRGFRIDYEREIAALAEFSKSQHRQEDVLVAFFGWFDDPDNVYLAMEYLALGDLSQYIITAISEEETKQIASDLLQGLKIMHAEGFTHRDLKPQNVFVVQKPPVSPTWWVKIGDFGIAKRVKNAQTALRTEIGTPHYQAPEILGYLDEYAESSSYNSLVDIWSLGCVLYKIITQEVPFPSASITMRFCNGKRPFDVTSLSKKVSPLGTTFIAGLLIPLPQERPTAADALRSPWLQSMEKPSDAAIQVTHRSEKKLSMESKPKIDSFSDLVLEILRKNEFKHTPLPSNPQSDEIRILVLQPGEPEAMISCTLMVFSLSDANEKYYYEALSHYWGTDGANCEIKIHELTKDRPRTIKNVVDRAKPRKFYIRPNLHAALSQLRDKDQSINLWVDALCIDQDDEREKNQQVSIMAKIYSGAHRTLIRDESTVIKWDALVELMRCRWFSRRWVVQELVFATEATLHYDDKSIYWTEFADAIALFVTKFDNIKDLFRSSRRFNHNPEHWGDIMGLGASNLVNVASNLFRRSNRDQGQEIERLSGLEALVSSLLSFEASDPRDTVYALLSIAKDDNAYRNIPTLSGPENTITPLAPDYNKTIEEVYRDFTRFCIQTSRSIDIICRHWAPSRRKASATTDPIRITGKKKRKEKPNVKMPSWVPSLDGSPFGNPESALNGRVHGDSLVGHPDRKNYNAAGRREANVRFEEIISTMSSEYESSSLSTSPLSSELSSGVAFTNTATENSTPSAVFFLHVKGFQVDIVHKVSSRIAGGLLLRENLIMGGWDEPEEDPSEVPEALWRALVAGRSPEGGNPPSWYHRACLNCFAHSTSTGDIDTGALIANPRSSSIMTTFLRRVQSVVWNRKFLKSAMQDYFGLAPMGTEEGDIICILFGCSVPVILREHRSLAGEFEYYELIGEAYVYGLMDGEALHKILPFTVEVDFKLG